MAQIRSDELNAYEYVDKVVLFYTGQILRKFRKLKKKKFKDKGDFLLFLAVFYDELFEMSLKAYTSIAKKYYKGDRTIDEKWVKKNVLDKYDPVTLYVFTHEVERKKGRHAEAVIASDTPEKEHDNALKLWSNMFRQYADIVADTANLASLKDSGEEKVMWLSIEDNRRCAECKRRHEKIYPISKVPSKPHIGCRCWVVKVDEQDNL